MLRASRDHVVLGMTGGCPEASALLVGIIADAVDDTHGADEDLAGCKGAHQPDADLPVEAQGFDRGLEPAAQSPGVAVAGLDGGRLVGLISRRDVMRAVGHHYPK